jgi:DNA polymerase III alpha subunit
LAEVKRLILAGALDSLGLNGARKTTRQKMLFELLKSGGSFKGAFTEGRIGMNGRVGMSKRVGMKRPSAVSGAGEAGESGGGQGELFETRPGATPDSPEFPAYTKRELQSFEFESLGFLVSAHPLDLFSRQIAEVPHIVASGLKRNVGRHVTIVGMLVTSKLVTDSADQAMEFVTFEDRTGLIETVVFAREFEKLRKFLNYDRPLVVRGKVEEEFGVATLVVEDVRLLAPKR